MSSQKEILSHYIRHNIFNTKSHLVSPVSDEKTSNGEQDTNGADASIETSEKHGLLHIGISLGHINWRTFKSSTKKISFSPKNYCSLRIGIILGDFRAGITNRRFY